MLLASFCLLSLRMLLGSPAASLDIHRGCVGKQKQLRSGKRLGTATGM